MSHQDFNLTLSSAGIDEVVEDVRRSLKNERETEYTADEVRSGMQKVLHSKLDLVLEGLRETFTSPQNAEFRELAKVLSRRAPVTVPEITEAEIAAEGVFSGMRDFSGEKYAAMMEYFLSKGRFIYKTSLNKLLFYSDMTAYYLNGRGISGAVYINRPFGPVADPAEDILQGLIRSGRVTLAERTKHLVARNASPEKLTKDEIAVLDWVMDTYGEMGAREISDLSHSERAYKDTKPNEPIAYKYAEFLRTLPPRI